MTPWDFNQENDQEGYGGGAFAPVSQIKPIGVAQLLRAIKRTFQTEFSHVLVEGEIAQISRSSAGHLYLTVKDKTEDAALSCAVFRPVAQQLTFSPKQGDVVQIAGSMNVFAQRGQMNLIAESVQLAGEGDLYAQFLRLKARLQAEGLFDDSRKKPVPAYPARIGVITSREAAALHDVVRTIRAAAPFMPITRYTASVQGDQALDELIDAIERANSDRRVDVLLLVRGGGSIGDLWTYNLEPLARAIAASAIPIVAGVGHESDITIADLVADVRAATPTAAASYVTRYWAAAPELVQKCEERLRKALRGLLDNGAMRLDACDRLRFVFFQQMQARRSRLDRCANMPREFSHYVQMQKNRVRESQAALGQAARARLWESRQRVEQACGKLSEAKPQVELWNQSLDNLSGRLAFSARSAVRSRADRVAALSQRLAGVNVEKTLARGYAIARDDRGRLMRQAADYRPGDGLTVRLADGSVKGRVTEISKPGKES